MFKGHPKGLFVLALANMGERFGYYTMLAIFVLFMQAKFGFSSSTTSTIFGVFLASVYFLPLFGGMLADKKLGYGKTVALGIVVMFAGYFLLAIPTGTDITAMAMMFGALLLIALGTGFFKGNLQVIVGNLYDDPKYATKRDIAFSIFYMCINIGAFFAPSAAEGVSNYFMGKDGYSYDKSAAALYHQIENKTVSPDGFVNLGKVAAKNNTNVYDQAAFAVNFSSNTTDSIAPEIATIYASLLTPEQVKSVDERLDKVVANQLSGVGFTGDSLQVQLVRRSILAQMTPVSDTVSLRKEYAASLLAAYKALGSKAPEEEDIYFQKKDVTAEKKVEALFLSLLNDKLAASLNLTQLKSFGKKYTESLTTSYNYGFGVACISLIVSMLIFVGFKKIYASADKTEKQKAESKDTNQAPVVELTPAQTKERLVALGLVFTVVIFFWMAFHQNGLTMTFFARDYTQTIVTGMDRFGFSLLTLVPFAIAWYGVLNVLQSKGSGKIWAGVVTLITGALAYWAYYSFKPEMDITPQIFQQFNAYFIVLFTPIAVAAFSYLNKKGKEPLAPRKIGIGMVIAAIGFVLLAFGSLGLPTPTQAEDMGGVPADLLVSPNWLIGTYFILTIAELFLSPMGISFVSKVSPPKYKGLMQGGWLAATAVGNYLVAIIGYLWGGMQLWMLWGVLVVCCIVSAIFLFSVMKRLEKITRES